MISFWSAILLISLGILGRSPEAFGAPDFLRSNVPFEVPGLGQTRFIIPNEGRHVQTAELYRMSGWSWAECGELKEDSWPLDIRMRAT